jgi:DNA topoisomerase-1
MSKNLVIVESPAKAKTIGKYLGKDYQVMASVGHIMDLPKKDIGVEIDKRTFVPTLIVSPGKEKVVEELKKAAKKVDHVFLAPDPDREGEAIAYHLALQLEPVVGKAKIQRVTFNEITQKAVKEAFKHARQIDQNLVDAQQTRRVLDRLVGYQISPLLWDNIRRGLSAGRVQTVAVRLIVEREEEIRQFNPVEYWTIEADLSGKLNQPFIAKFVGIDGKRASVETVSAAALPNEDAVDKVLTQVRKAKWSVASVEKKERRQQTQAPFITSKLQQDASRKLGFNVKRTMGVAQRLYEGVDLGEQGTIGLITYMRTDSTRVSPDAVQEAREWIGKELGKQYLPAQPNVFKSKKDAQDAHEAIRPTDVSLTPDSIKKYLSEEYYKLYKLIWQRFVASQMVPALFDVTTVDIVAAADKNYDFRINGSVVKFDGFLRVYEESKEGKDDEDDALNRRIPALEPKELLRLIETRSEQHFTQPPPRYNEASLVKELEQRGVGRPSTYASIINTIQDREYVTKISARFYPTEIGTVVTQQLVKNFPYIFDTAYTARLEEELDEVEEGKEKWTDLLRGFYEHFEQELDYAEEHMDEIKRMEIKTDQKCENCGAPLILRWGKFGTFFSCSAYNKKDKNSCTFTKENFAAKPDLATPEAQQANENEEYCENCGRVMVMRRGRFGMYMACPGFNDDPPCKTMRSLTSAQQQKKLPPVPTGENCPQCSKPLVTRQGSYGEFVSCSGYPKCKYIKQNIVEGVKCPDCGKGDIAERKARKGNVFYGCTNYPKCKFTSNYKPVAGKCPDCGSPYLLEKTLKSGVFVFCPNNKKPAAGEVVEEAKPKRGKKAAAVVEETPAVVCAYIERIGDPPLPAPTPTAETHGPVTLKEPAAV